MYSYDFPGEPGCRREISIKSFRGSKDFGRQDKRFPEGTFWINLVKSSQQSFSLRIFAQNIFAKRIVDISQIPLPRAKKVKDFPCFVWKFEKKDPNSSPLSRNCGMVTCFFSPTVVRVWFDKQDLSRKFVILIFFQCFPQYFTFFIISFALSRPKIFQRCKRPKKLVIFSKDFNPQLQRYIRQHASEPYSIKMQIIYTNLI